MNTLNERKGERVSDLVALNKSLESFAYRVSHDLLSPINSIKTLVSFIEEESKEEHTKEYIKIIKNRLYHLDQTIQNNLKNSKTDSLELQITEISLEETVQYAAEIFSDEIKAYGINFQINFTEQETFFSDKFRLNTLLENLIANAVKYQNKDRINKEIVVEGYSDSDKLRFSISDNGIGIAKVNHDKIFDKFFRESYKFNGYGIGLHIVKQTVEILQGTVKVKSVEGIGSTFIVELKNFKVP